jgi:hypothetical protein
VRSTTSVSVTRRAALGVLGLACIGAFGAVGCKCKSTKPAVIDPPPKRPDDVLVELVVRDPTTSWGRVKDVLGLLGLTLPKKPFISFADSMTIPAGVEHALEPTGPLVGVVCDATPYPLPALAWKVDDPDHLATFEPERFELKSPKNEVRWWRRRTGDLPAGRFPLGISDRFLVAGPDEALVEQHAVYLRKGPGTAILDADVRFDVTERGARTKYVEQGLDQLDAFAAMFAEPAVDRPTEVPAVAKSFTTLAHAVREWAKAGKPMRLELSLAKDALMMTARALDAPETNATTVVVPGSVIRWLARANLMSKIGGG